MPGRKRDDDTLAFDEKKLLNTDSHNAFLLAIEGKDLYSGSGWKRGAEINRILNKSKWTGADVGKALLGLTIQNYIDKEGEGAHTPYSELLTVENVTKMNGSLRTDAQRKTFERYNHFAHWISHNWDYAVLLVEKADILLPVLTTCILSVYEYAIDKADDIKAKNLFNLFPYGVIVESLRFFDKSKNSYIDTNREYFYYEHYKEKVHGYILDLHHYNKVLELTSEYLKMPEIAIVFSLNLGFLHDKMLEINKVINACEPKLVKKIGDTEKANEIVKASLLKTAADYEFSDESITYAKSRIKDMMAFEDNRDYHLEGKYIPAWEIFCHPSTQEEDI